mmetsp:Transcript_155353/g.498422  ORF Transcript_155353/g.498422 Transcript_155353/m.498422 type:complete len:219 (+) Transcript_155353:260-916(+)
MLAPEGALLAPEALPYDGVYTTTVAFPGRLLGGGAALGLRIVFAAVSLLGSRICLGHLAFCCAPQGTKGPRSGECGPRSCGHRADAKSGLPPCPRVLVSRVPSRRIRGWRPPSGCRPRVALVDGSATRDLAKKCLCMDANLVPKSSMETLAMTGRTMSKTNCLLPNKGINKCRNNCKRSGHHPASKNGMNWMSWGSCTLYMEANMAPKSFLETLAITG